MTTLFLTGYICGFSSPLFADNWSQTAFPTNTGTYSNTAPANANTNVTLAVTTSGIPVGTDHGGADWIPANGSSIDSVHYNIGAFTVAAGTTVYVTAGISLTVYANTASISGTLSASGRGYNPGSGPGAGGTAGANSGQAGGGAGYGGNGGIGWPNGWSQPGGPAYGNSSAPTDFGSGGGGSADNTGGTYTGGSGGGNIRLFINGTLTVNGSILSNGNDGPTSWAGTGAGSGGTIYLRTSGWVGTGSITANGGNGGSGTVGGSGGGGAGGRVAYYYNTKTYSGTITVNGGSGYASGANGTIYNSWVSSGTYISAAITPAAISYWAILTYTKTTPVNTILTVDVLSSSNNALLVANVPSGTNLQSAYPATFTNIIGIKLQANLTTSDPTTTPQLAGWGVEYATGAAGTTANWTSLIAPGQKVAMGQPIAQAKFDMQTTSGTAHWKRFRVDKYARAGQALIPDDKIVVQVWMENNGDGFFDAGDQIIAQGTFTNNTCYLNMNRWAVTTTPKTYYIVYKFAPDCGGGQYAGVNIGYSSYLEFEDATCVGVPP